MTEIRPNQSIELLKELHILTRDGKLNQDSRRKLKQIYHLFQFIEPLLIDVINQNANEQMVLVDHGAGKSYLGFIIYDLFFKDKKTGFIYGVEGRSELVEKSTELAKRCEFARMKFINLTVQDSITSKLIPVKVDIVTALHACDTATDDAIDFALNKNASKIVLIPCCQAEVSRMLNKHKAKFLSQNPIGELWRHPIHTREFGAHLTNVLRCLLLQSQGYRVTVTELTGWEHSMKNELILAEKISGPSAQSVAQAAQTKLQQIISQLGLSEISSRFLYST